MMPGNLLVDPIKGEEVTVSGLVRPEQYEDKAYKGRVIKGEDPFTEGTVVYFNKYSWITFPYEGKEYISLRVEDVIAYAK